MAEPVVAKKGAYVLDLEAGEYFWCACGHSKNQPFCDGSHAGTGMEPHKFTVTGEEPVALCGCKHTATPPFCDGAHKQLKT
ncbi:hypothetical protein TI05_18025 [Achromatium sp. WMS3]|nr:hypothetical protein TI05_18025 [Achromatium sp. WMS3]